MPSPIHPRQVRAARALLAMSQEDLAAAAQVGLATVKRFESGKATRRDIQRSLRSALEVQGVILLEAPMTIDGQKVGAGVAVSAKAFAASIAREAPQDQARGSGREACDDPSAGSNAVSLPVSGALPDLRRSEPSDALAGRPR